MTQRDQLHFVLDDVGIEMIAAYSSQRTGIPAPFAAQYTTDWPFAYTPTINACVENGITFTQARTSPICSPTRAATLSGLYPFHNQTGAIVRGGSGPQNNVTRNYIDFINQDTPTIRTIAHHLSENGYSCQAFGKWHLYLTDPADADDLQDEEAFGGSGFLHPIKICGFERWTGTPRNLQSEGGTGYVDFKWYEWDRTPPAISIDQGLIKGEYATEMTLEAASKEWLSSKQSDPDKPIFQWIALNIAHSPWEPADWPPGGGGTQHNFNVDQADGGSDGTNVNTTIRAMLEHFDFHLAAYFLAIGFDPTNPQDDDPVIFIWGDNGTDQNSISRVPAQTPASPGPVVDIEQNYPDGTAGHTSTHPGWSAAWGAYDFGANPAGDILSVLPYESNHFKGSTFEQGIRIPLIVCGNSDVVTRSDGAPGEGAIDDSLVDMVDFFATSASLGDCLIAVRATGSITVNSRPDDGSTFTVSDGDLTITFEFDDDVDITSPNTRIITVASDGDTAVLIRTAINASALKIHATVSASVVSLTHKLWVPAGNVDITTTGTTNCTFVGMAGGASAASATDGVDISAAFSAPSSGFDTFRAFSYGGAQFAPNGHGQTRRQELSGFIRADGVNLWKRNNAQRSLGEVPTVGFYNVGTQVAVAGTGTIAFSGALTAGDTIIISDSVTHDDADLPVGNEVTFVGDTDFTVGVSAAADMTALVAAIVASSLTITPTDGGGSCTLLHDSASYCNNDAITFVGSNITATGMNGGVSPGDPLELCDLNSEAYLAGNAVGTTSDFRPELVLTETLRDQVEGRVDSPSTTPRSFVNTTMTLGSQLLPL